MQGRSSEGAGREQATAGRLPDAREQRTADDRSESQVTTYRTLDNVLSLICRMYEIGTMSSSQIKVPVPDGSCHLAS